MRLFAEFGIFENLADLFYPLLFVVKGVEAVILKIRCISVVPAFVLECRHKDHIAQKAG